MWSGSTCLLGYEAQLDHLYNPVRVLGQRGHHLAHTYDTSAAHAQFPHAMHLLSLMCPLSSGFGLV